MTGIIILIIWGSFLIGGAGEHDIPLVDAWHALERYKAKQFIGIIADAGPIAEFDNDLNCVFVEKTTVMGRRKMMVSLLDGTDVECDVE